MSNFSFISDLDELEFKDFREYCGKLIDRVTSNSLRYSLGKLNNRYVLNNLDFILEEENCYLLTDGKQKHFVFISKTVSDKLILDNMLQETVKEISSQTGIDIVSVDSVQLQEGDLLQDDVNTYHYGSKDDRPIQDEIFTDEGYKAEDGSYEINLVESRSWGEDDTFELKLKLQSGEETTVSRMGLE